MSYNEYPKAMKHPAYRPAVIAKWDPKIKDAKDQPQGSSAKFPGVIVHNLDQEQEYAAKGYKPNGVGDPEAYRKSMTGNVPRPDGSEKEYPKYLYRPNATLESGFEDKLVSSKEEEQKLGKGWFRTPDLARAAAGGSPVQAASAAAPEETAAPAGGKVPQKKAARVKAPVKKAGKKKAGGEARA